MSERPDPYRSMRDLADLLDSAGRELRIRADLGMGVLEDPEVAGSRDRSPGTYAEAEALLHAATSAALTEAVELDADALMLRATMLTYRRIDGLQEAAYRTLGEIAGRAAGYLAPEVALGGSVVSAGLIEMDPDDRDQVARYLSDLAAGHPELLEHVSGGGLLDVLQMRSRLTSGMPTGDAAELAAEGGRAALGIGSFLPNAALALREAFGAVEPGAESQVLPATRETAPPPRGLEGLMTRLDSVGAGVLVQQVATGRWIAYLGTAPAPGRGPLRLVGSDRTSAATLAARAIQEALAEAGADSPAHVLLVGSGRSGGTAARIAAQPPEGMVVDQVVAACSPASQVPGIPEPSRLLCLENRTDPVTALGSLVNAEFDNQVLVLFEAESADPCPHIEGGRTVDRATDPLLREEVRRLEALGYLRPPAPASERGCDDEDDDR